LSDLATCADVWIDRGLSRCPIKTRDLMAVIYIS